MNAYPFVMMSSLSIVDQSEHTVTAPQKKKHVPQSTGFSPTTRSNSCDGDKSDLAQRLVVGSSRGDRNYTHPELVEALVERMTYVHRVARECLKNSAEKNKRTYDTLTAGPRYDVGDAVWLQSPRRRRGISPSSRVTGKGRTLCWTA